MKYKLTTIKDIFEQIPEDRIEDCMSELTVLILQAKRVHDLFLAIVNKVTGKDKSIAMKFPEFIEWIDDKKGTIDMGIKNKDKRIMTFKYKLK